MPHRRHNHALGLPRTQNGNPNKLFGQSSSAWIVCSLQKMGEEDVLKHLQFLNNHNLCANVSNTHTHTLYKRLFRKRSFYLSKLFQINIEGSSSGHKLLFVSPHRRRSSWRFPFKDSNSICEAYTFATCSTSILSHGEEGFTIRVFGTHKH